MHFQALRSSVRLQFSEEGGREFFGLISLAAYYLKFYDRKVESRGFNKHQRQTKQIGYFAHRSWLLFPLKLEAGNKVLN